MFRNKLYIFAAGLLFWLAAIHPALAQVKQAHTQVSLISEQNAILPGQTFWVGIKLATEPQWHVYWQNPGDSGFAPRVKWTLPEGFTAGEIHWPYPQRLSVGPLTSFGYENGVLLLVGVTGPAQAQAGANAAIHAHIDWLACREICIPGKGELDLSMPVVQDASQAAFNASKADFDKARADWPQTIPNLTALAVLDGGQWRLDIQTPYKPQGDVLFYPYSDQVIEHAAPQETRHTALGYELRMVKSHIFQGDLQALEGIAVNPAGWLDGGGPKAIVIQAPVTLAPPPQVPFLLACLFALIGGLVLNLMPCVLPVLSIKVLHLVERHPDKGIALRHSLVYALGILVSVWALALLLFILKAAGEFAGWGFQFQSPVFVIGVAIVLFVLALNLFGLFEFSIPAIGGIQPPLPGYQASFISGVVTTIVASPCTAPFMGTALAAAISQPNIIGFGIFTCLGLGLALPFIVLSAFPSLLALVPKPGAWMVRLKQFLGIILLACVLWLVWVFGMQTGLWGLSNFTKSSQEVHWQSYSPAAVMEARRKGEGVFIDFTAAWCINCQVNDRLVLQNPRVITAFREQGISTFKADWTKYDPVITQALTALGRDSIPVYVYYAPGSEKPVILPQIITPGTVLEHLKDAEQGHK